jgi:peptide/nickel transport system permease protein
MWQYIVRRLFYMVITTFFISIIAFAVIQLPPGDFVDTLLSRMSATGAEVSPEMKETLKARYGLDQPMYVQYFMWISRVVTRGEFGYSWVYERDAGVVIWERLPMSFALAFGSFLIVQLMSIPIGIYSAVRKYHITDYIITFFAFVGRAIPSFLLALIILFLTYQLTGRAMIGLFSEEFVNAPWSMPKFMNLLSHLWIPALIIGLDQGAVQIRVLRANLLDELNKPYVDTGRAKGLPEFKLLMKYPVRHSINPLVSTLGWALPGFIGGEALVSIVLNLPTSGPIFLNSLFTQDMYLAAGFVLMFSVLTVIGTFISDILLALLDPRVRMQ